MSHRTLATRRAWLRPCLRGVNLQSGGALQEDEEKEGLVRFLPVSFAMPNSTNYQHGAGARGGGHALLGIPKVLPAAVATAENEVQHSAAMIVEVYYVPSFADGERGQGLRVVPRASGGRFNSIILRPEK